MNVLKRGLIPYLIVLITLFSHENEYDFLPLHQQSASKGYRLVAHLFMNIYKTMQRSGDAVTVSSVELEYICKKLRKPTISA